MVGLFNFPSISQSETKHHPKQQKSPVPTNCHTKQEHQQHQPNKHTMFSFGHKRRDSTKVTSNTTTPTTTTTTPNSSTNIYPPSSSHHQHNTPTPTQNYNRLSLTRVENGFEKIDPVNALPRSQSMPRTSSFSSQKENEENVESEKYKNTTTTNPIFFFNDQDEDQ